MVMNRKDQPRKGLWITGLVIQGAAVLLLGRYLITLDTPTNILSSAALIAAYLAIVVPTVNVIRGKTKSSEFIVALGVLNIVAAVVAIGFLFLVASIFDSLHYDY